MKTTLVHRTISLLLLAGGVCIAILGLPTPEFLGSSDKSRVLAAVFVVIGTLGLVGVNVFAGGPLDLRLMETKVPQNRAQNSLSKHSGSVDPPPYLNDEEFADYQKFLAANPPDYIKPYAIPLGTRGDEHSLDQAFSIQCTCGELDFVVRAAQHENPAWYDSPMKLTCTQCEREIELFDYEKHGYDGVVNTPAPLARQADIRCKCVKCQSDQFTIEVIYQYYVEEKELVDKLRPELKPQDLFSWFSCQAKCANCETTNIFLDYECA